MKSPSFADITRTLILPALIGLLAGVAGGIMAVPSVLYGPIDLTQLPTQTRPSFTQSSPLPEADLADRLARLDLPLYPKKAAASSDLADKALAPADAIGMAVALTSDGWLLTHQSLAKGSVVVAVGSKLYEPKTVVTDPSTGAVFMKIDDASLQVSGFEETDLLREGTALFVMDAGLRFAKTAFGGAETVPDRARPNALRSSDRFVRAFALGRALDTRAAGGAVLTVSGNLAGIVLPPRAGSDRAEFLPMHFLRPVLDQAFRNQPPVRAKLGVNYVDLESVALPDAPAARGAVVTGSRRFGLAAVAPGSAAAKAGIKEGDVLTRLGGIELGGGRDLAELLAEYRPGAKVKLDAVRAGAAVSFEVTLD